MTSNAFWEAFAPETNQSDFFWGVASVPLIERWPEWINRRIETIEFRERHRAVRRVSLDIEIPSDLTSIWKDRFSADKMSDPKARIPLTFLSKSLLVGFSMRGPDGTPLPLATRSQNRNMCWWALVFTAQDAVRRDVSEQLKERLWDFVDTDDCDEASAKLIGLLAESGPDQIGLDVQAMKANRDKYRKFYWLASELAQSFVLFAYISVSELGSRHILKFEYDEPIEPIVRATRGQMQGRQPPSFWGRRATYLSLRPTVFDFPSPATGAEVSYHFEAEPPRGLVFADGSQMVAETKGRTATARMVVESGKAHFHMPALPSGAYESHVSLHIAAPRDGGLLRGSRWVVAFITLILMSGAMFTHHLLELQRNADAAGALLLALPGLLAAYFVRPTEHVLASEVLRGVRALVVTAAVALYIAAWTVLFAEQINESTLWGTPWLKVIWASLATLSAAVGVLLWVAGETSIHVDGDGENLPESGIASGQAGTRGYPVR